MRTMPMITRGDPTNWPARHDLIELVESDEDQGDNRRVAEEEPLVQGPTVEASRYSLRRCHGLGIGRRLRTPLPASSGSTPEPVSLSPRGRPETCVGAPGARR